MRRFPAVLLLMTIALTGCIPEYSTEDTASPARAEPRAGIESGRLAYIAADGNIYITTPGLYAHFPVTQDATTSPEGPGLSYPRVS